MNCPLCFFPESELFDQDKARPYHQCTQCSLLYVPRDFVLGAEDEKKRYDTHNNSLDDPRYEAYLQKIVDSIIPYIQESSKGLDFGCGETELLKVLFQREGIYLDSYDIYFLPEESIWRKKYDFIVLSEVIEHLREPRETMEKLSALLNPNGQFFIKTKTYPDEVKDFRNWYYKRDPTHIQFFNQKSFLELSRALGLNVPQKMGEDLYQFKK